MSADNLRMEQLLTVIAHELYIARMDKDKVNGEALKLWEPERQRLVEQISDLKNRVRL